MQMTRGVELGVEEFGLDNTANICKNRLEWDSCRGLENVRVDIPAFGVLRFEDMPEWLNCATW